MRISVAFLLLFVCVSCSKNVQTNWHPQVVGGPLEIRPLPSADDLPNDYTSWLGSGVVARAYEIKLQENIFTNAFEFYQKRHDTPLGRPIFTTCRFNSSKTSLEKYQFRFSLTGKYSSNSFDFSKGKTLWVQPLGTNLDNGKYRLQIIGMEGMNPFGVIVATKH